MKFEMKEIPGHKLVGGAQYEKWDWPSREEWASERRTPYYDRFPETPRTLSNYASAEEVAALKIALRERWRTLGKKMRAMGGPEPKPSREEKYRRAARGERTEREQLQDDRSLINCALKLIEQNELPARRLGSASGIKDLFAPYLIRYEAEDEDLCARRHAEILETSIDDEAWNAELQRRARFEQWWIQGVSPENRH